MARIWPMDWCLIDTPIAKMQLSGACHTRTTVQFAGKAGALHEHHAFFSVDFFAVDQARL